MPLIADQPLALQALASFEPTFEDKLYQLMCAKLGWMAAVGETENQKKVIQTLLADLLKLMAQDRVDYTLFWRRLSQTVAEKHTEPVRDLFLDRLAFDAWMLRYSELFG
jgi:uncharacterized protein YdiU (UPF0061 family)